MSFFIIFIIIKEFKIQKELRDFLFDKQVYFAVEIGENYFRIGYFPEIRKRWIIDQVFIDSISKTIMTKLAKCIL